jgi:hypothetical protein
MAENQWSDEFRGSEETPRRPAPSGDQWEGGGQPPKAGMSGGMKAFLIIAAILGTLCVLCCGIGGFFVYSFVPKVSTNPADINAARDEVAKIELPAGFEPAQMFKIDNFMMTMTAVGYKNPAIHGSINFAQMKLKVGDPAQRDQAMRQQLDKQGFGTPKFLTNAKSETKTIKIKGQDCNFVFKRGDDSATKKKADQISGVFEGNHGPVSISIEMDDSAYKEDAIVKMLEAIQ